MNQEVLDALRATVGERRAWIVGGALRDRLLGREVDDLDIALEGGEIKKAARELARRLKAHVFSLSDEFETWRVLDADRRWHIDLSPLRGGSIEADLGMRDFTINAMAEPVDGGEPIDPFGGLEDLAKGRLRMVSRQSLSDDPLRLLRLVRLACELELRIDPETAAAVQGLRQEIDCVASERVLLELRRTVSCDRAVAGVELLAELGLDDVVLPELSALKGVGQSEYHHLDAYEHTLAVLAATIKLERDPGMYFDEFGTEISERLSRQYSDELTHWQALRFAALLHDCAKPQTRAVEPDGRVTFYDHDVQGTKLTHAAIRRLRGSERLATYVASLTRSHLRLGFLVGERPLNRRQVYGYLKQCDPFELDVTVLSVADRLATKGKKSEQAIADHLSLTQELLPDVLAWQGREREPLIRGSELARELKIKRDAQLGQLLAEIDEARYAGEITTSKEAVTLARRLVEWVAPVRPGSALAADAWQAGDRIRER